MDFLNEAVLWWHWIVFGILLIVLELTMGTFFILILAFGAIMAGFVALLIGLQFSGTLGAWILFSLIAIAVWFKYFKQKNLSNSGQSSRSFDTPGTVTKEAKANETTEALFDMPVLGNKHWFVVSKEDLALGDRVQIIDIEGQLIVVQKIK